MTEEGAEEEAEEEIRMRLNRKALHAMRCSPAAATGPASDRSVLPKPAGHSNAKPLSEGWGRRSDPRT